MPFQEIAVVVDRHRLSLFRDRVADSDDLAVLGHDGESCRSTIDRHAQSLMGYRADHYTGHVACTLGPIMRILQSTDPVFR